MAASGCARVTHWDSLSLSVNLLYSVGLTDGLRHSVYFYFPDNLRYCVNLPDDVRVKIF